MTDTALSVEEIEKILHYWENKIDGVKWSDDDRELCVSALTESKQTAEWWMKHLIKVPNDINARYRKIMKMLADKRLISAEAYQTELEMMEQFSPAELTRRGGDFAAWYRQEEAIGFACAVY